MRSFCSVAFSCCVSLFACADPASVPVARVACTAGSAGTPSAKGGCCSEWIPCASGLTCASDGPTYGAPTGVCTDAHGSRCAAGTAGQASGEGGYCSEWIACAQGLTCVADGPVYPGSQGICAR